MARRFWMVGLTLLFCFAGGGLARAAVTAQVDRSAVTLGDGLNLTLVLDGVQSPSRPVLPNIPDFQVDQRQTGSGFTMINGAVRQTYQYLLIPAKAGNLTIPSLPIRVGNQTFATQPILIQVVPPAASVPGNSAQTPLTFGKVVVPRNQVYVGEVFPVEIQLYVHNSRQGVLQQVSKVLDDGFRMTEFRGPTEKDVPVNNQVYRVKSYRAIATAVKTGAFTSGPISMVMAFGRPSFFGEFFPESQHRLAVEALNIQVLPIPTANMPPNYSGALGSFSLRVTAGPTNVTVGDPVTVKVQITGSGQFESLALPTQTDWREFKTYSPNSTIVTNDGLGVACTKTFEQVVIPQNHEVKALPPFVFSFFDPEAKTFRTLTGPAIPLHVLPSAGASGPLPTLAGLTNKTDQAEKQPEIATIKVHLGVFSPAPAPLFRQGWFLALQLVPPALWLSLLARRRFAESLARNPRLLRQRQVAKIVSESLQQLRAQAAAHQTDEFFATVVHLLQEQIGERLDVPASAITEAVVDERLRPLGLTPQTLAVLHGLFQKCNLARYAGTQSKEELTALVEKVEGALATLKQLPDPEGK